MSEFDINTDYKNITTGNSDVMLQKIDSSLPEILDGKYNRSCRPDYRVLSHYHPFNTKAYDAARKKKTEEPSTPFRKEEWMCKMCYGKTFSHVGKIVDYQVPIKHSGNEECKGMGKIDLLTLKGDTAYLLELKVPDSSEAPLRAIMEVYTYWKQLGGNACAGFLNHSAAAEAVKLKKAIVIFEKDCSASNKYLYVKLIKDKKRLCKLMKTLGVECFIAKLRENADDCDEIIDITPMSE